MLTFKQFINEKVVHIDHEFDGGHTVKVHHNPSASEAKRLSDRGHVRGTHSKKHGVFMWNADEAIHYHVRKSLKDHHGLDISDSKYSSSDDYRDFSIHDADPGRHMYVHHNYRDKNDNESRSADKEAIMKHPSLAKLQHVKHVNGY